VRRPVFAVIAGLFGFLGSTAAAVAEETSATEFAQSAEQGGNSRFLVEGRRYQAGHESSRGTGGSRENRQFPPFQYRSEPGCTEEWLVWTPTYQGPCIDPPDCPEASDGRPQSYQALYRRPQNPRTGEATGLWELVALDCAMDRQSDNRLSLWQLVEQRFRALRPPGSMAMTQPRDRTLVNLETIFYAEHGQRDYPVGHILGHDVVIRVEGVSYLWDFGDGETVTTKTAGAKYPSKEIVHRYRKAGQTVHPSVTVTYRGSFSVDGGAFQPIPGTVTVAGQPGVLEIAEARSELVAGR